MRAQETNVLNLVGGLDKVFVIPPFQRNYEWSYEQCEELFKDIEIAYKNKKTHYLGNIVYYVGENNGASYSELILVDGQQRITTILILLCALRDKITDENIVKSINMRYLKNEVGNNAFRVRLKQTSYDLNSFVSIVDKLTDYDDDNNVVKNYKYFIKLIEKSDVLPKDIYETISNLEVVDVNLKINNDLNAIQTVFEKINSTGKILSPADLIRNYLLLSNSYKEQEDLYNNYWVKIEQTVKNQNISRFSRDYLILNIFDDVAEGNIYKKFKEHFTESQAEHKEILNDMCIYSKYYAWLKFENCPNDKINRIIKILNFLKSDDVYPLYLFCLCKLYNNNLEELKKILQLLADFMLRYRVVAPSGGGGTLRSVVNQLLEKLNSEEIMLNYDNVYFELSNSSTLPGRFPDNNEFKEALMNYDVNINYARVVLLRIEEKETKNIPVSITDVTVEHLMPQKLTEWWVQNLGGQEEAERIQEKYLNCIGNLAPMSMGYNSKNSNKPWNEKLKQIRNVQFAITSEIAKNNDWKEQELKRRNEDIAERACKAVTAPLARTRKYQVKGSSDEFVAGIYPVSDVMTPMGNTNVTEIIFNDKVIKVSTWKEFLRIICEIAYELDKLLFEEIVSNNKIHKATSKKNYPYKDPIISKQSSLLVGAKRISQTDYFVEGIISSSRARFYAKQLLDIYGKTDEFKINVQ